MRSAPTPHLGLPWMAAQVDAATGYAATVYDYYPSRNAARQADVADPYEVYALTAYLLNANGVAGPDAVMNAATLPAVRMPNRDGFIAADSKPDFVGDRCMSDCK